MATLPHHDAAPSTDTTPDATRADTARGTATAQLTTQLTDPQDDPQAELRTGKRGGPPISVGDAIREGLTTAFTARWALRLYGATLAVIFVLVGIPVTQHAAAHLIGGPDTDRDVILTNPTSAPAARVAYLVIDPGDGSIARDSCTGNLVGPDLLLTAAHCLTGDGHRAATATALLGYHLQAPTRPGQPGVPAWTHTCHATQAWAADTDPHPYEVNDWALLRLTECSDTSGPLAPGLRVGDVLGYHRVAPAQHIGNDHALYLGYPRTRTTDDDHATTGALHEVHTRSANPTWTFYYDAPTDGLRFAKTTIHIASGGSGGALLHPAADDTYTVAGVLSFNRQGDGTYFIKTTPVMAAQVEAAMTGPLPRGWWELRPR